MESRVQRVLHGLRWCGAAMVLAAAGTFLVQSWEEVGDVERYLCLLGMTAALPVLAYVCGVRLAESRSARVALITLLGLFPIHAGVLGGFVLSQFGPERSTVHGVAQWVAPNMATALLLVVGSALVLLPLTWAAYRVLCREHAGLLTVASGFMHGLLLVPERSALGATCMTIPMLATAGWTLWRVRPTTREAKIAVGSLLGPAVLLVSRQLLFYEVTAAFWGAILSMIALAMFILGEQAQDKIATRLALVPTLGAVGAFWLPFIDNSALGDRRWRSIPNVRFAGGGAFGDLRMEKRLVEKVLRRQRSRGERPARRSRRSLRAGALGGPRGDRDWARVPELRLRAPTSLASLWWGRPCRVRLRRRGRTCDRLVRAERLVRARAVWALSRRGNGLDRAAVAADHPVGGDRSGCQTVGRGSRADATMTRR